MINPIQAIGTYKGNDLYGHMEKMQLVHIFDPLFQSYPDKEVIRSIAQFIVFAYSLDSEYVPIKSDWGDVKKRIFSFVGLQDKWYKDVVEVQSDAVRDSIIAWLNEQDNSTYTEIKHLQDLKLDYQRSFYMPVGEVSYDQKFKNSEHLIELDERITTLRNQLTQNSDKLKVGVEEVRASKKKGIMMGPEKFATKN